jgi:hypothetical protein
VNEFFGSLHPSNNTKVVMESSGMFVIKSNFEGILLIPLLIKVCRYIDIIFICLYADGGDLSCMCVNIIHNMSSE